MAATGNSPRRLALSLGLTLVVAALLRLHRLGAESLWLDEAFSIAAARRPPADLLKEVSADFHPPLHFLALHVWMKVAGSSEFGARLLSVVFSLGTIAAAWAVTRRLLGSPAAILAALLLAFSPFQVEFAQEARMYALLALLATVSMHSFLGLLDDRWRGGWFAAYVAVTTAMLYTHVYGAFVVAGQGAIVAWTHARAGSGVSRVVRRWLTAQLLIVMLFGPWIYVLAGQVWRVQRGFWIPEVSWSQIGGPLYLFSGWALALVLLLGLVTLGAHAAGVRIASTPGAPTVRMVLLAWLAAPILLPFLASKVGSPIFLPKYTIAASVPFAILAARGVVALPGRRWRAAALGLLVAVLVPSLLWYFDGPRKDAWRDAVAALEARAEPGDLVLLHRDFNDIVYDYYRTRSDLDLQPLSLPLVDAPEIEVPRAVRQHVGPHNRVWLVMLENDPLEPLIVSALAERFSVGGRASAHRIEIILFER